MWYMYYRYMQHAKVQQRGYHALASCCNGQGTFSSQFTFPGVDGQRSIDNIAEVGVQSRCVYIVSAIDGHFRRATIKLQQRGNRSLV